MATRAPTQTKDCTFPHCDGRMILASSPKIDPVIATVAGEEPVDLYWFWLCDRDPAHTEAHKPRPQLSVVVRTFRSAASGIP